MGVYLRKDRRNGRSEFWIDADWRSQGIPRIQKSTRTTKKTRAAAMMRTLEALRDAGRRDLLALVAEGRLSIADAHDMWQRDRDALEHVAARRESPSLGTLGDEWLDALESPATISPRTRRPLTRKSIDRYRLSLKTILAALPKGRQAALSDLTQGFVADYRASRKTAGVSGASVNRDLAALQSFLRWVEESKQIPVPRLKVVRERESSGRERWLNSDEIAALRERVPADWWLLFELLIHTGLRIGEAQALRWGDIHLADRFLSVREYADKRLKSETSRRDVPLPDALAAHLAEHAATVPTGIGDPVFPGQLGDYWSAHRVFVRAAKVAKLEDVRIHDLRHTFGVHAAQAGIPLPRLQKLMGHATPNMTMRYAAHAPTNYFAEDAARIAASMDGSLNEERSARAELARKAFKVA